MVKGLRPERPWIRMLPGTGDGHMHGICLGCMVRFVVGLPAPLELACKIVDLYIREHRLCRGQWQKRGAPLELPK